MTSPLRLLQHDEVARRPGALRSGTDDFVQD